MSSTMEHLNRCREERIAKEKARIERLRELNLKKYGKIEAPKNSSSSSIPVKSKPDPIRNTKDTISINEKKNIPNSINKRPFSVPTTKVSNKDIVIAKSNNMSSDHNMKSKINNKSDLSIKKDTTNAKLNIPFKDITRSVIPKPVENLNGKNLMLSAKPEGSRKTLGERKSIVKPHIKSKVSEESVFDRLYKPKVFPKQSDDNLKLKNHHSYLKKATKEEDKKINRRQTVFENKPTLPVRRSISAVHFKKINKSELRNCIHKWASVGEKINKEHVKDVNEDDSVKDERIISAVKSERKRVKFQTPIHLNFNTPKPEELQTRLQKWLQKRGKSIGSYHHLQCFGLHHLTKDIKTLNFVDYDDEDKENIAIEQDIDNVSLDGINDEKGISANKWRRVSSVCDSVDYNDSYESTLNSEGVHHVDELLLGALNDLTDLLREGFDWEQCARWLRAIRERYPLAPNKAAYWECRAALEERRGDLPASMQCWEQAIAAGTEQSVVEANLDNLLDKFMQLKISPNSGKTQIDSKLVDIKNVFKSTIIRFAVQHAKLRQSTEKPKYTVTPVRRSSRISMFSRTTPRRVCTTIHQATELGAEFIPNKALINTP